MSLNCRIQCNTMTQVVVSNIISMCEHMHVKVAMRLFVYQRSCVLDVVTTTSIRVGGCVDHPPAYSCMMVSPGVIQVSTPSLLGNELTGTKLYASFLRVLSL